MAEFVGITLLMRLSQSVIAYNYNSFEMNGIKSAVSKYVSVLSRY